MSMKERMKKLFSILLCLLMLVQSVPVTVFAAAEDGLCEHHTEHTAECGYAEAVAGSDCTHSHDGSCGYAEAVAEVLCTCEATDENGALVHTEGCGYVAPVEGSNCAHVHDEACGYAASVSGSVCTYHCHICHVQELVDALPGEVTAENAEAVAARRHPCPMKNWCRWTLRSTPQPPKDWAVSTLRFLPLTPPATAKPSAQRTV